MTDGTPPPDGAAPQTSPPSGGDSDAALQKLLESLTAIATNGVTCARAAADYVRAQWRLGVFRTTEEARLALLRATLNLIAALMGLATWVFACVALWRGIAQLTDLAFVPPLVLAILHGVIAWRLAANASRYRL